jgi:N-formylglutamate amidohydrolase
VAGAAVPAHRHTHHEACRSTGEHPPAAANTVRAVQDSLLRTNQERFAIDSNREDAYLAAAGGRNGVFNFPDGIHRWGY